MPRRKEEPELQPKALRYADKLITAEQMLVDAVPDIMAKLITMAKDGDMRASRYLLDRAYGKAPHLPAAPVVDTAKPYTKRDWAVEQYYEEKKREKFREELIRPIFPSHDEIMSGAFPGIGQVYVPQDLQASLLKR